VRLELHPSIQTLLKRFLIGGILLFYAWIIFFASQATLPDGMHPLLFYSSQTRQDIKQTFYRALSQAKESIFLSVYGISDPDILTLLKQKNNAVALTVEYDPSASRNLKKIIPYPALVRPIKSKGLMHKKIIVIDHALIFLGSANLTTSSLRHHANFVLGLYHPPLAAFLEESTAPSYSFRIQEQTAELFLLPDPQHLGMQRLLGAIEGAKKKINIAMFTLTHPDIVEALIRAKKRGVNVSIAVDYYTAKGASKKALATMQKEGINIYLSQGKELLHHKWSVIDDALLVMGSANWTKAAFCKNDDFLLFLFPLQKKERLFLKQLWKIVKLEAA